MATREARNILRKLRLDSIFELSPSLEGPQLCIPIQMVPLSAMTEQRSTTTSLKSILPKYLRTPRLTLELFDYSTAHYSCLLESMNTPTAHKNMGNFGITTPPAFDELNSSSRHSSLVFKETVEVDTDVYYLPHLGDENGPLMGGISLAQRGSNIPPDMGWCMLEVYHGKDYAVEAAKEVLRFAREDLGIEEVIAWPGAQNLPSINVPRRVGFVEGNRTMTENGEQVIFVLPGMSFDGNVKLSMYGENS
jgi:RimJ/RimL family protein N-acetyltransferase